MILRNIAEWNRSDWLVFAKHRNVNYFTRDLHRGEVSTLPTTLIRRLEGGEWLDQPLAELLRQRLKQCPEGSSLRVTVVRVTARQITRFPVIDWPTRDKSKLWRLGPGTSLEEFPISDLIARVRQLAHEQEQG